MSEDVREKLADVQHEIWSHWMHYMFSQGTVNSDGTWTMPAEKVRRWGGQMRTPYSDLTDKERESDRDQADKIIIAIRHLLEAAILAEDYGQRASAAEAALAAVPIDAIQRMQGCEAHTDGTELAKITVREWLAKNGRFGMWPENNPKPVPDGWYDPTGTRFIR